MFVNSKKDKNKEKSASQVRKECIKNICSYIKSMTDWIFVQEDDPRELKKKLITEITDFVQLSKSRFGDIDRVFDMLNGIALATMCVYIRLKSITKLSPIKTILKYNSYGDIKSSYITSDASEYRLKLRVEYDDITNVFREEFRRVGKIFTTVDFRDLDL